MQRAIKAAVATLGYVDQPGGAKSAPKAFAQIQVTGTAGDDRLAAAKIGNSRVDGGAGDDLITGGAAGSDGKHELVGGKGDDNYTIRSAKDTVIEKTGRATIPSSHTSTTRSARMSRRCASSATA